MSIINRMLKDLDHRQALATANEAPAPSVLRLLPATREPRQEWLWRTIAALMLVALGWACWVAYEIWPRPIVTDLALRESFKAPTAKSPGSASLSNASIAKEMDVPARADDTPGRVAPLAFEMLRLAPEIITPIRPPNPRPGAEQANKVEPSAKFYGAESKGPVAGPDRVRQDARDLPLSPARPGRPPERRDASISPGSGGGTVDKRERTRSPLERAELSFRQAVTLLNQGRATEAEEQLLLALNTNHSHQAARQMYIAMLIEQGKIDAARRELQVALEVGPGQPQFIAALARIYVDRREYASALDVLSKIPQDSTASPELLSLKAGVLQRMGRHSEASEAYERSLRAAPDVPSTLLGYAISLDALGRVGDAIQIYKRVLAAKPLSAEVQDYAEKRLRATR